MPGGLVFTDGHSVQHARLRPLTGREEEWLARYSRMPAAARVTWILRECLIWLEDVPVTINLVRQLLVGDRDYLILQLRHLTLGDEVHAVIQCPACNEKIDVDFRVSEIPIEQRSQTNSSHILKLADRSVRFRLPTGGDQEAVLGMTTEEAMDELFDRCLLDDGGKEPSKGDRETISEMMGRIAPEVNLELDLMCTECNHGFIQAFDTTAYFFDEMVANGKQLLREVHALALYYHWSERDILSLTRDRRREYLGLLHESLQRQD